MPPPGPGGVWGWFRRLSPWVQAAGWLIGWPVVVAVALWRAGGWARVAALALAVIGTPLWLSAIVPASEPDPARVALEPPADEPADDPTGSLTPPVTEPAQESEEPSEEPAGEPSPEPPEQTGPPGPAVPDGVPRHAQPAVVEKVVDGDTLWVRIDQPGSGPLPAGATHKVRLLQIDTPETQHPTKGKECWGSQATDFAADRLALGSTVWLLDDQEDTDRFGRFLRYLWTDDGRFFNRQVVRRGHGRAALYEPNDRYIELMRAAEGEARADSRGMWGRPCDYDAAGLEPPPAPEAEAAGEPLPDPGADGGCHPSYRGACVPVTSDVDCAGGSGDGPEYVGVVKVAGPDDYDLDRDDDGLGCEPD